MGRRRFRRLLVGPDTYRWHAGHVHSRSDDQVVDCREVLLLRKEGRSGHVRIVFPKGEGGLISDGTPYTHDGGVRGSGDDDMINLHRPRVVRAFADVVTARGHDFASGAGLDGWSLLPAV
ncbi:MAG TPA: hypothetical protein VIL71_07495, partial [Spirillospora sp.]